LNFCDTRQLEKELSKAPVKMHKFVPLQAATNYFARFHLKSKLICCGALGHKANSAGVD